MKKYYLVTLHYDVNAAVPICSDTDKYKLLEIMQNMEPVDDTEYSQRAIISKKQFKRCNSSKDYIVAKIIYSEKKVIFKYRNTYIQCIDYMNMVKQNEKLSSYDYKVKIMSVKKFNKLLKEGYELEA